MKTARDANMKLSGALLNVFVVAALGTLAAAPARAASLQKIEQSTWSVSGLPSYVNMSIYVPDKLAAKPPILVASHHCGGSSSSTFNEIRSTFVSLADKNGFLIIFPEATGHNCWDVGSTKSLTHDGGGDTHAIAQMVRYALSRYHGDPSRVYAFGTSSGAMMTEALLGVYPDMFMAGVSVAGVPCGCWAAEYTGDSGANPQWSGPCAGGRVMKPAQAWGDLVRAMFPGYMGHRPRVQLWHGTADTTISYINLGESIKEWTNVLQLDETPAANDDAKSGYTHQTWKTSCGYVALEAWSQQGAGHDVSWDAASAAKFLGLDQASPQDPEALACPGTSGAAGAAGMSTAGSQAPSGGAGDGASAMSGRGGSVADRAAANGGGAGGDAMNGAAPAIPSGAADMPRSTAGARAASAGTPADDAGARGAAGVTAAMSAGSVPASGAHDTSSGGCACVVGTRGARPTMSGAAFVFGVLCLFVRRRRPRPMA
jgi:poly(hydroxyalkanoate) depolymerase family esterase